jgi:acetoacetyl-CoA reductase
MFRKMSPEDWKSVIDTNLNSMFNVTKQVYRHARAGWGRIINISRSMARRASSGQTNYSAAKAGMHGFTMALAQEVAAKGVTVNTVSPGYIATDMVMARQARGRAREDHRDDPGQAARRPRRSARSRLAGG